MKFRIVYKAWWMFWAGGMAVWPWVWFKSADMHVSTRLFRHELEHCYQIKRKGRLKFYVGYLLLLLRYGYKRHPYEIEANERENDPLTPTERAWKDRGRIQL